MQWTLLMNDPILIRRPLMIIGSEKLCGFDSIKVAEVLDHYVEADAKNKLHGKRVFGKTF